MNKQFAVVGVAVSIVLFVLNAIGYEVFLKDFFQSHPAVSPEFMRQLYRPDDQMIGWAVVLCTFSLGFLVTIVVKWSGARSFPAGLRSGFAFAILFLCSVDFGLLGTTNNYTTASAFADIGCSTTTVTLAAAFAAWMFGRGKVRASEAAKEASARPSGELSTS
jgi:hypothetical protein